MTCMFNSSYRIRGLERGHRQWKTKRIRKHEIKKRYRKCIITAYPVDCK